MITALCAATASAGELKLANLEVDQEIVNKESSVSVKFDIVVTPPVMQSSVGVLVVDPTGEEDLICSSYSPPGLRAGTYDIGYTQYFDEDSPEGEWSFTALLWQASGCPKNLIPDASETVTVIYDRTAPEISFEPPTEPLIVNEISEIIHVSDGTSGSGIDWDRSDMIGGIVEDLDGNLVLDTSTPGLNMVIIHLVDFAGNEAWASYEYEVHFNVEGTGTDGAYLINADSSSQMIDGVKVDGSYESGEIIQVGFTVTNANGTSPMPLRISMMACDKDGNAVTEQIEATFDFATSSYEIEMATNELAVGVYQLRIEIIPGQQIELLVAIGDQADVIAAAGGGGTVAFTAR